MLQIWLPLNGNLNNQGLADVTVTTTDTQWQTDGKIGSCLKLGVINKFTIPSMVGSKQMSFSYWVRVNTATSTNWLDSITWYSTDGNSSYTSRQEFYTNSTCTSVWYKGGSMDAFSSNVVGEWNHYVFTIDYEKGESNYYINGKKHGTTHTNVDTTHYLRGDFSFGQNGLDLSENDIRIYDHILSPREVKEISKGLVLHYPLSMPGQENLVKQSNQFNVGTHAAKITPSVLADGTYQVIAESGNSNYTSIWWMTTDGIEDSFVEGETFTISFTIKSNDANKTTPPTIYIKSGMGYYSMKGKVTDAWSTVYYTGTWKKENSLAPHLGWAGLVGTYHIMNWKIERGSRPTPWLPNPADTKYTALGFNDGIEYDVSGYGNNGTRNGTFSWSSDTPRYNTSTYINSSSSINHPRCLSNDDQEWTCCAWVKLDNSTSHQQLNNFNKSNSVVCNTTPILYLNDTANDYYMYGSQVVPVDEWTHIAFVFKNSTGLRNIYINGILKNNYGPNKTSTPYGIPDSVTLFGQNFVGYVSDYREYATALSPQDVRDLYSVAASISDNGTLMASEVSEL